MISGGVSVASVPVLITNETKYPNFGFSAASPSLPTDAPLPKDRRKTPVVTRVEERDPPTEITKQIAVFKILQPLVQVRDLEFEGPCPKDYSKVQRVHDDILERISQLPAYFRLENPDTRWDEHPGCRDWIQAARFYIRQVSCKQPKREKRWARETQDRGGRLIRRT